MCIRDRNKEYAMSILRTEGIIKDYPGTRALDDVTVSFNSGKVHAFIGKNGSGTVSYTHLDVYKRQI